MLSPTMPLRYFVEKHLEADEYVIKVTIHFRKPFS
jgi:hypothetical protein